MVCVLLAILLLSGSLSYFIPQGAFLRDEAGNIIPGTYEVGQVKGISFWRVLSAPVRVFGSEDALSIIMISVFLLIMSGIFNLLEKTEGLRVIIGRTVKRFSSRREIVIALIILIFMAFGSFFGMFEELVTLLPLVIVFMLSMGYDTMTGLGVCMMAACFGFSAAITNPFSVGIAAKLAGTHVMDGAWLRILFFVIIYAAVLGFVMLHIRRISKNPMRSPSYEVDLKKHETLDLSITEGGHDAHESRIFKVYGIFFLAQLVVLVCIACIRSISGFAIPILAVSFLIGGILAGLLVSKDKFSVFRHIGNGAIAMLPAIVMIALASSVKLIMTESGILDTVMHGVVGMLMGRNKILCVILIYILILFLQVFIGSSSAKIMLIMPIILPIASLLGLSPTVVILTYCIADGFTDVILPTNPVLLVGLSMAYVPYGKWVKWTWKFQVALFVFTLLLLALAVQVGY